MIRPSPGSLPPNQRATSVPLFRISACCPSTIPRAHAHKSGRPAPLVAANLGMSHFRQQTKTKPSPSPLPSPQGFRPTRCAASSSDSAPSDPSPSDPAPDSTTSAILNAIQPFVQPTLLILTLYLAFWLTAGNPDLSAKISAWMVHLLTRISVSNVLVKVVSPGMSVLGEKTVPTFVFVNMVYYWGQFSFAIFLGVVGAEVKNVFTNFKNGKYPIGQIVKAEVKGLISN
eukprot:gene6565-3217_t